MVLLHHIKIILCNDRLFQKMLLFLCIRQPVIWPVVAVLLDFWRYISIFCFAISFVRCLIFYCCNSWWISILCFFLRNMNCYISNDIPNVNRSRYAIFACSIFNINVSLDIAKMMCHLPCVTPSIIARKAQVDFVEHPEIA